MGLDACDRGRSRANGFAPGMRFEAIVLYTIVVLLSRAACAVCGQVVVTEPDGCSGRVVVPCWLVGRHWGMGNAVCVFWAVCYVKPWDQASPASSPAQDNTSQARPGNIFYRPIVPTYDAKAASAGSFGSRSTWA
ncbi:predicted protein [Plenodomus lingam JN3]|uniref:Predicted protein n=1 Tax=Leptosphaeria maculans (strain JN3 / isolate v23.1.3 / race Av1-4-5-6-7-8) TaxID=985895 RepID=E5R4M7_LEPMJ|nr:predicted protein [Plenodomus lingam JN3]CBX92150.1 predicted protein [Plenodomus lingam JN3]